MKPFVLQKDMRKNAHSTSVRATSFNFISKKLLHPPAIVQMKQSDYQNKPNILQAAYQQYKHGESPVQKIKNISPSPTEENKALSIHFPANTQQFQRNFLPC